MKGLVTRVECSKDDHELSIMNGLLKRLINGRFIHVNGYSVDVLAGTRDCSTAELCLFAYACARAGWPILFHFPLLMLVCLAW